MRRRDFIRMVAAGAAAFSASANAQQRNLPVVGFVNSQSARDRGHLVAAFQRGEAPLFLLSLKAGGVGLNLTAATEVIHLDPWWNPAVEDQASDRAHRLGQGRPVTIYRLIAMGTIEEQMLGLHAHKRALVEQVLRGSGADAPALSVDDLLGLLASTGDTRASAFLAKSRIIATQNSR